MAGIFPYLDTSIQSFRKVDLNRQAELALGGRIPKISPYLDPREAQKLVDHFHRMQGPNCRGSYGGFGELRSTIWKGSYLEETNAFTHLGTDYNVPVATAVAFPWPVDILDVHYDLDEKLGWGPRICARMKDHPIVVVYAHLEPHDIDCRVGDTALPGQVVGFVGVAPKNGNTFSHLHVQMMHLKYFRRFLKDGDGYGQASDLNKVLNPEADHYDLLGRKPFVFQKNDSVR